jgi:hypothetical protein
LQDMMDVRGEFSNLDNARVGGGLKIHNLAGHPL